MTISSKSFSKDGHKIDEILADPFEENVHDLGTNISGHEIPEIEEREKKYQVKYVRTSNYLPATIFEFW